MSFKPGDFYLGVVSFLGVLLPGAIFIFLLMTTFPGGQAKLHDWRVFGSAAYVCGHLLLAASEILNSTADRVAKVLWPGLSQELGFIELKWRDAHHDFICAEKAGNKGALKARGFSFHTALSYVRLRNPEAAAEVDHHMADYKLLRSLVLVLLLNSVIVVWIPPHSFGWAFLEILISALAYLCFVRMYNWARYLAFSYSLLLSSVQTSPTLEPTARRPVEIAAPTAENS